MHPRASGDATTGMTPTDSFTTHQHDLGQPQRPLEAATSAHRAQPNPRGLRSFARWLKRPGVGRLRDEAAGGRRAGVFEANGVLQSPTGRGSAALVFTHSGRG